MKGLAVTWVVTLAVLTAGLCDAADFDIRKSGASPTNDPAANAVAIQKAIDAAASLAGRVVVPAGEWVSGTLWLKGGVELHLEKGAVLKASPDLKDYNAEDAYPENWGCPKSEYWRGLHFIVCRAAENVSITGEGTIHGNGDVFFDEKPIRYFDWMTPTAVAWWNGIRWAKDKVNLRPGQLVVFVKCRSIRVEGVTIRNAPCWSLYFYGCQDVTVRSYTVRNGHDDGNTDGVDIDCCKNVLLEDLDIDTGDDAVAIRGSGRFLGLDPQPPCENVTVRRAKLKATSSVFRIGVGEGLIRNVTVEDVVCGRGGTAINLNACFGDPETGGVDMEDIVFRRCRFENCRQGYCIHSAGKRLTFGIRRVKLEDVAFAGGVPNHVGADAGSPEPKDVSVRDIPDVTCWHGANLLGLFNAAPQKPDPRAQGRFDERHFRWFKEWGFNFARLPMDYRYLLATNDWTQLRQEGFAKVDEAVAWGRRYGVHVQLCLHRAPGFTIASWVPEAKRLQTDADAQEAFMRIWREFARRYCGIPNAELSFNLINEPQGFSEQQFIDVFGRTIDAIRTVDPNRFVMLDGNNVASTPVAHFYKVPLTGQAFRGYTPHAISHYGAWYVKDQPEVEPTWPLSSEMAARKNWIYEQPETTFAKYTAPRKIGYPVMVGEFGCYSKVSHTTCLKWMEHCLRIWKEHGLGWAIWNVDGAFGFIDSGRADVDYEDFEGHKLDRKMLDLLRRYATSVK